LIDISKLSFYQPARYTAIERDQDLVKFVSSYLDGSNQQCLLGHAKETGLPDSSCSVVCGEAMMNMMPNDTMQLDIDESARILKPDGRYGFQEVYLKPDDIDNIKRDEIALALRAATKVGVTPFTISEWMQALAKAGFEVREYHTALFHFLIPSRAPLISVSCVSCRLFFGRAKRKQTFNMGNIC
jgi:hypothetical protein